MSLNKICKPVVCEWPIFLSLILLRSYNLLTVVWGLYLSFEWFDLLGFFLKSSFYVFTAYLFTWLAYKSKVLKYLIYAVLIVVFFIAEVLSIQLKTGVNPDTMMMLLQTNSREASEFFPTYIFNAKLWLVSGITAIAGIVIIGMEMLRKRFKIVQLPKWCACIVVSFLLLGAVSSLHYSRLFMQKTPNDIISWCMKNQYPGDIYASTVASAWNINCLENGTERMLAYNEKILKEDIKSGKAPNDSLTVIFVMGESFIKHHSSLYGYRLKTNPKLEKEKESGNLFVFTNVQTRCSSTNQAISNVFSCNSLAHNEQATDNAFFPALFKNKGYFVSMLDNQRVDNTPELKFRTREFFFNEGICKMAYSFYNDECATLDGDFVKMYEKQFENRHQNQLIILHLQGQHHQATTRYRHTPEYTRFKSSDYDYRQEKWLTDEKKQLIAEYDNCTFYNDAVISHVFDMVRDRNAVAIYLSDHGEEIYDYRDNMGRVGVDGNDPQMRRYIYEIPFMVWCSDRYIQKYPERVEKIRRSLGKSFTSDNVCQLLFTLSGLQTIVYKAERDLLS